MSKFQAIAAHLQSLAKNPQAMPHYDLFADALVWSDEVPSPLPIADQNIDVTCLRGVWHYRSSMILGKPEERHRPAWEAALELFPLWPGFDPARREFTWRSFYEIQREAALKKWEEDEDRNEKRLIEQSTKATA
jgi:hypothetical protein